MIIIHELSMTYPCPHTERNRGPAARDIHSYPGNEDFDPQAEIYNYWNVLQALPGPAGFGGDISQL